MTAEQIDQAVTRYDGVINLTAMACRLAASGLSDDEVLRLVRAHERNQAALCGLGFVIGSSEAVAKLALEAWRRLQ